MLPNIAKDVKDQYTQSAAKFKSMDSKVGSSQSETKQFKDYLVSNRESDVMEDNIDRLIRQSLRTLNEQDKDTAISEPKTNNKMDA